MNQNKFILRLLWAAGLVLITFILSDLVIGFINQYKKKYQAIRTSYMNSMREASSILEASLSGIASNPKIMPELTKDSYHSLNRELSSYLRFGEVDNIHVFDNRCQLLTAVNVVKKYSFDCLRIKKDGVVDPGPQEKSMLSVSNKMLYKGSQYYVVSHVQLNSSWVKAQAILSELFATNDLAISSYPPSSDYKLLFVSRDATIGNGLERLLWINEPIYRWFYFVFSHKETITNIFYYPLLMLLLLIFLVLIFLIKKQLYLQQTMRKELMEWSDGLKVSSYFDLCKESNQSHLLKATNFKDHLRSNVTTLLMTYLSRIKGLEKELVITKEKTTTLLIKKEQLKEFHCYTSLALQLGQCGRQVVSNLESIESSNQDISDIINSATRQDCKNILKQSKEWQEGIVQRGPRKFIRSLSETMSQHSSKSNLEEQIDFFVYSMEKIDEQLSACALKSLTVNTSISSCLGPFKNWYQQVCPYKQTHNTKLSRCLFDLKNIMELELPGCRVNFIIKDVDNEYLPDFVPEYIWRSGFYHLMKAITSCVDSSQEMTCVIKWIRKDKQNTFSFSIIEDYKRVVEQKKLIASKEQWDFANKLFFDYDVFCDRIVSAENMKLFALKWEKNLELESVKTANLV